MTPGASGTTPGPTPEILEAAENKLAIGRTIIRKRAPYLAPTIYGFIPHVVVGLNTLGVTKGMVLYYDPVWLAGCKDHEVAAALVHESQHHVRDHLQRSESMINKEIANIALDEAINPHLREAGWELPHGVFPEDFGHPPDLTAEEYYALHMQAAQQQPQPSPKAGRAGQSRPGTGQPGPGSSGQGPPPPKSDGPPGDPGGEGQGGGEKSPGGGEKSPGCGSGRCGGIAGNPLRELEDALDNEIGRSPAERKAIQKQTLQEIKSHVSSHGRGSVPADLLQALEMDGQEKSKIRWQDELRHAIKKASGRIEAGGMDFSLARPSKRSPARGFPRPGLVQYLPEIALILDTSGSMGSRQILDAIRQAIAIIKSLGVDSAWFLQADAQVADKPKRIRIRDLMGGLQLHGRGGTRFDPALQALEKLRPRPDLAIYLTDGDGHVTYRPKGIEVIWCIVHGHYNRAPDVPWGRVVIIEADGKKKVA